MKIGVFSSQRSGRAPLESANAGRHQLTFLETRLDAETAELGAQFDGVCIFVNDALPRAALQRLRAGKTRLVALRCAGFDNVDIAAAKELGLTVVRVPAYSPYAVAEFAASLVMTLNRKLHRLGRQLLQIQSKHQLGLLWRAHRNHCLAVRPRNLHL